MIEVTDPAKTPAYQLAIVIAVLQAFHDGESAARDLANLLSGARADSKPLPPVVKIAAEDRPDTGADVQTAAQAFGNAGATEAFGAAPGNGPDVGSVVTSAPTSPSLPPAAPSAPSAAAAHVTAGAVDVDKHGLPWDARIHAGTKRKNADGTWTAKRGVEDAVVAQVEVELRQLMNIPGPAVAPAPVAAPVPNVPTGAAVTPPPAPPIVQAAPAAVPGVDFAQLAALVGQLIPAGRLTQEKLQEIVSGFGLPNFGLMFNRPDLVPGVHAAIKAVIGEA
jgi:hypothetical protein